MFSLGILCFDSGQAAEVRFTWDPNSESDLAGYKLYYENETDTGLYTGSGADEGDSPVVIDLEDLTDSDSPTFTISGLEEGVYYYFALTAFNTSGLESDFSNEVNILTSSGNDSGDTDDSNSDSTTGGDDGSSGDSSSNSGSGSNSGGSGGCFISEFLNR